MVGRVWWDCVIMVGQKKMGGTSLVGLCHNGGTEKHGGKSMVGQEIWWDKHGGTGKYGGTSLVGQENMVGQAWWDKDMNGGT